MRCFIGIDLGSTTTKAVVIDEHQNVLGRGITNSRSNYDTAAAIAKQEALLNGRFYLFRQALSSTGALNGALDGFLGQTGRSILTRLLGLILAALAVQFVADGVKALAAA